MQKRLFISVILLLTTVLGAVAQVTTSSMAGKVTVENGDEAVIGATIQAVHEPSGTRYTAVTNVNGLFTIQGMRTGGPYDVTVSYIGLETKTLKGITLQLGETYNLNVWLSENSNSLTEVVITGKASKFTAEKTGASTNITNEQMMTKPTISRSISDLVNFSPYSGGNMSFAGGSGRMTNYTIDGANFNNNFGLSSSLPGGGNPISLDAIDEVQVVIAPYDVRQTNFIGGGINAVTKSGTNTFKGTAYYYYRNQDLRGNKIDGEDLGTRAEESKKTYGFTLGGPIIKNKLFFFANYEKEITPGQVIKYRAREDGEKPGGMISRTTKSDMEKVHNYLLNNYGYDTGSWTDYPADEENEKLLVRLDWNITDAHHLAVRYNSTKNTSWVGTNGSSGDFWPNTSMRLNGTYRIGLQSMAFANSIYSNESNVKSVSADLNSRFGQKASNQLLYTYTHIEDPHRGSPSSIFPAIDIMAGQDADGKQIYEPYMYAGYELFTYNNGVKNNIHSLTDNFTYYLGTHKLTAGFRWEYQYADNSYMREGTGYYRFTGLNEFLSAAAPEQVAFTYGFNGESNPTSAVRFNQIGWYLQDEWNITPNFKFSYGVRFDDMIFSDKDIERNNAIYNLDFNGYHVDTGRWPKSTVQVSPRVGFTWDVFGDKILKVRGGTGIFTGRLPLVFFTNMGTNANTKQITYAAGRDKNGNYGDVLGRDAAWVQDKLQQTAGKFLSVAELVDLFEVPKTNENHVVGSKVSDVDKDFKMPQVWKSSIAVDYQLPVDFPLTVTGEFMFTKNINAVYINNLNINATQMSEWEHFNGADNRLKYPTNFLYYAGKDVVQLTNTSKGYGYTANVTVNAEPIKNLNLMAAYTYTESKEISGMPGSDPVSTYAEVISVDGPNYCTAQRSQFVTPHQVIASVGYYLPVKIKGSVWGTHINLFYKGYSGASTSFLYSNDMNGDGVNRDLIYIPANDSEIKFKSEADRVAFWQFVDQDNYLSNHRGEYAEAYAQRAPWLHRVDLRIAEDFEVKVFGTKQKFQASLDIINFGNLLNSSWGVSKTNQACNYGQILKYEGVDAQNNPIFSMNKVNGKYPTQTYETSKDYGNCWKMQIGLKYFFN